MKNEYSQLTAYCLSKIGNVYFTQYLSDYFERHKTPIKTACLHPGLVNTEIFNIERMDSYLKKFVIFLSWPLLYLFAKCPYYGAQTTLHMGYMDWEQFPSGAYFNNCHPEKLKDIAKDSDKIKEFRQFTKLQILNNWKDVPLIVLKYFD
jgi:hypothetical protein